jgi:hypothetical protein
LAAKQVAVIDYQPDRVRQQLGAPVATSMRLTVEIGERAHRHDYDAVPFVYLDESTSSSLPSVVLR